MLPVQLELRRALSWISAVEGTFQITCGLVGKDNYRTRDQALSSCFNITELLAEISPACKYVEFFAF